VKRQAEDAAYFAKTAEPILCAHCIFCHNDTIRNSEASFAHRSTMLHGGRLGPGVIPGDPENSLIVRAIRRDGRIAPMMPPGPPLSNGDVETMVQWAGRGAPWGDDNIHCNRPVNEGR
jgi:cytochrome c